MQGYAAVLARLAALQHVRGYHPEISPERSEVRLAIGRVTFVATDTLALGELCFPQPYSTLQCLAQEAVARL